MTERKQIASSGDLLGFSHVNVSQHTAASIDSDHILRACCNEAISRIDTANSKKYDQILKVIAKEN